MTAWELLQRIQGEEEGGLDEISSPILFATASMNLNSTTPLSISEKNIFHTGDYPSTIAYGPKTPGKSMAISKSLHCEEKLA